MEERRKIKPVMSLSEQADLRERANEHYWLPLRQAKEDDIKNNLVLLVGGEGCRVWDADGKEYLDLSAQLTNVNLGHNRKDIIAAAQAQMNKLMFAATMKGYAHVASIEYAHKLAQVVPKGLGHFLFANTGSDADDCAFKIANTYYKIKRERNY